MAAMAAVGVQSLLEIAPFRDAYRTHREAVAGFHQLAAEIGGAECPVDPLPADQLEPRRNVFSTLFLGCTRCLVGSDRLLPLYAMVNQCMRAWVTACDNLLDDENKEVLRLAIAGRGPRTRAVLTLMLADRVLNRFILDRYGDAVLLRRVGVRSLAALVPSALQECEEEVRPVPVLASSEILASALPGVRSVLRRRTCAGILVRGQRQEAVALCGVEPVSEAAETVVAGKVTSGSYLHGAGGLLLGKGLAERLVAAPGAPVEFHRPGYAPIPFTVCGVFRTGVELLDGNGAFVSLDECPRDNSRQELAVFLRPGADARRGAAALAARLPGSARVSSWEEALAELVQLISLNHVAMNIVQLLALVILAFGVSNTAFISVGDRTRELGILKAVGFSPAGIRWAVLGEVLCLVALAGLLGDLAGCGTVAALSVHGLDLSRWTSENPHFIASGVIFPRLTLRAVLLPVLVSLACGLAAALLPAFRAGRITVTEALRNV